MAKSLPNDLILDIMTRLPVKSIFRFKCVSKEWLSLFQHDNFVNFYNHSRRCRAEEEDDGTVVNLLVRIDESHYVASIYDDGRIVDITDHFSFTETYCTEDPAIPPCNGLLCIRSTRHTFTVCNPATNEFVVLPLPLEFDYRWPFAFGFDPNSNKFKAVYSTYLMPDVIQVLTLGDDPSWRIVPGGSIQLDPVASIHLGPTYPQHTQDAEGVIYLNGELYWYSRRAGRLSSFDLSTETFGTIPPPSPPPPPPCYDCRLCECDGRLCIMSYLGRVIYLWLLTPTADSQGLIWVSRRIRLPFVFDNYFNLIAVPIRDGQILVQCVAERCFYYCHYDLNRGQVYKKFKIDTLPQCGMRVFGKYQDSLLPLKQHGKISLQQHQEMFGLKRLQDKLASLTGHFLPLHLMPLPPPELLGSPSPNKRRKLTTN